VIHAFKDASNGQQTWYPNDFDVSYGWADASNDAGELQIVRGENNEISMMVKDNKFDGKLLRICVSPKEHVLNCGNKPQEDFIQ
jgi:hypothetical protein